MELAHVVTSMYEIWLVVTSQAPALKLKPLILPFLYNSDKGKNTCVGIS